ncbi:MAG: peptidylprolyl isomerase [Bacteroidetes bacterium]|nr:peptidylprolyl isomerase [Bacteroidota bacterium]
MTSRDRVIAQTAQNAFGSITGAEELPELPSSAPGYSPFFTQEDLSLLGRYSGATVTTTKGAFTIRFDKNAAPLTVLNFILLAKKGFYTGLPFHRVVANFVIQGGDPLGNGSGGPEHSIRTEVHPSAVYRTGAVGMASAGKDTEGSQWFVTHCPTPHLDFRYSIFGYTQDRSVIDRVTVGDRILAVTLN